MKVELTPDEIFMLKIAMEKDITDKKTNFPNFSKKLLKEMENLFYKLEKVSNENG